MNNKLLNLNIKKLSSEFVARIFIQLSFPPLMLLFMGKENFDRWLYIFAIPTLFSIFQISVADPVRNHMIKLLKAKKIHELNLYYQNTFFFIIVNILSISVIAITFLLINIEEKTINENLHLIIISYISLFLNLINGNFYSVLTYRGSLRTYINVEIIYSLIINFLIPVSCLFLNFEKVILIYLVIQFFKTVNYYLLAKDENITIFPNLKYINKKILITIFQISTGFTLDIVSKIIKGPGLILILSISNFNFISMVSTLKTMFYFFPLRIFLILERAYFIEFANFFSNKTNYKKNKKIFINIIQFTIITMIIFNIFVFNFGDKIYSLWTNNNFNDYKNLIFIISLDISFLILGYIVSLPIKSFNKYSTIGFFELLINLTIFLFLYFNNQISLNNIFLLILFSSIIILILKIIFMSYSLRKYEIRFK